MILTVTMNPSIDIAYQLDTFEINQVNRAKEIHKTPGGKGLNVTRVLAQLKENVCATGLVGGKNGEYLQEKLTKANIAHAFTSIQGDTRNCIAILHEGNQTEILESGPTISKEEYNEFITEFDSLIAQSDVVVFSGSLPKGIEKNRYYEMVERCAIRQIKTVVDCSGAALLEILHGKYKPTVIKPNLEELQQISQMKVEEDIEILKKVLDEEQFKGIEWVIVSLGKDGCFAKHYQKYYRVYIPSIQVVNPVGSGDSSVAGIASAIVHNDSDCDLLKKANTLGMLNVMEKQTSVVDLNKYNALFQKIKVEEV